MNSVFAARLTKLRRERGMSQKDAAKMLGVSQSLLSHYETARCRRPDLSRNRAISTFSEYNRRLRRKQPYGISKVQSNPSAFPANRSLSYCH